ncbi:MAG: hypothetical protein IPN77_32340 [Sandaracinaceae bacterium]|nr:hypothetical protein [Sandaracinaceae bacterium]
MTAFTYDALNRVIQEDAPDGSVTKTGFNEAGFLETLQTTPRGEAPVQVIAGAEYNARGQRVALDFGDPAGSRRPMRTEHDYDPSRCRLADSHLADRRRTCVREAGPSVRVSARSVLPTPDVHARSSRECARSPQLGQGRHHPGAKPGVSGCGVPLRRDLPLARGHRARASGANPRARGNESCHCSAHERHAADEALHGVVHLRQGWQHSIDAPRGSRDVDDALRVRG